MNFFARNSKRSRFTVALALLAAMAVELVLPITTAKSQSAPHGPTLIPGQTATRLPDGRWLLAGGESAGGSVRSAAIWNPLTGISTMIAGGLQQPRAWHTATILPEGQVLIFGGVGSNGRALSSAELFDPETNTISSLTLDSLIGRAHHTATLMTDGHVLISGGVGDDGRTLATAELWSSEDGTVTPVSPFAVARRSHTSTLLPDGRVLLWGGIDATGQTQSNGEIFDQTTSRFSSVVSFPSALFPSSNDTPSLAASIPPDGMVDVPSDALIALRFSKRLRPETASTETITLSGPTGVERIKVVVAEDGRLVFVTPESLLAPGAIYSVSINGARDVDGLPLPATGFSFSTPASGSPLSPTPATQSGLRVVSEQPTKQDPQPKETDDDDWVWKGAMKNGKPHSPWQDIGPLKAEHGETALAGQVLDLKGDPLANVTLKMAGEYSDESVSVKTDETGRFLLTEIKEGWGALLIDGRSANRPGRTYGLFEVAVNVKEHETNVLPYTVWMPRIDTAHAVKIDSPTKTEIVLTTPKIHNLEVRIPAGSVIKDHEGNVVTEIGITPMPLDRPPFALPPRDVNPPAFFTIQPGVSYIYSPSGGARLIYPNYKNHPKPPRSRFDAWHYDAEHRGWYIYGQASVTEDGTQIVPDPGVSVYKFTGAMHGNNPAPAPEPNPTGTSGADPVDLGSGLFVLTKTDLSLPDVIPITLTRTYRQNDNTSRVFGIGSTHPYEIYLYSINTYQDVDLILPDGQRIHYVRISPGTGFTDAVYEHTATPTRYYKSRIAWNGQGWTLTFKDGTLYKFPESCPGCPSGAINEIHDRNGNKLLISRTGTNDFDDPVGNITQITSPNGRWVKFTYDASNRITQATDNAGRTVNYEYDAGGRLFRVTDPNNGVTEYTYDTSNRMLTIKDARNIVFITNEYDAAGRVKKQTMIDSGIYDLAYTTDTNGKITQTDLTDPRGNVRRVVFNSAGYPLSDTLALGKPEEQITTYQRDATSNLPLFVTDALNRTTAYTYDSLGNMVTTTRLYGTPDAVTTTYTYEPTFNQVATITDPLNHTTTFGYDSSGNLTTVTDPLNHATTMTYNKGQITSTTNPLSQTTQFTYDSGDLTAVSDPSGNVTNRFIDGVGRLAALTNPLGNPTRYEYDPLSRLTKVTDSLNSLTQFNYDPNGNLLSVTDPRSGVTGYSYNNMDRLETRTDPLLRSESYHYDLTGNLTQFTDRKNQITTYTYDGINRRTGVTYQDASTTMYTYDKGNRLLEINDSTAGIITRTYDGLDRLTSETTPQGSISYTYDAASRRETMTVGGQPTVNYSYDNSNRLTQITQGSSIVQFSYDNANRRTSLTLPNNVLVEYAYDNASRITSITYKQNGTTVLGDLTYEYDKAGNRTKIGGSFGRTGIPQGVSTTNYNAANHQTTFGDKTLTYDNNGNLQTITDSNGTTTYTWNARNQLVGISGPGVNVTFVYDGLGRREKKTINGNLTELLYDRLNPIQETSGATVLANILTGLGIDEFFSRTDVPAATTSHLLPEALGSALAVADNAGTVQTEYTYEPFGKTTFAGASSSNPYQYTGRENDGTGLFYYRARYYHPQLQRFISEDPLNFAELQLRSQRDEPDALEIRATWTLLTYEPKSFLNYAYVGNNPNKFTDPHGLFSLGRAFDGLSSLGGTFFDIAGNVFDTSGTGGYYGGAIGGAVGGVACSPFGPLAAAGCGVAGGFLGGALGGLLDPPCAGQLNCGELQPPPKGRKDEINRRGGGASGGWGRGASDSW